MIEDLRFLQEQGEAALKSILERHVGKEVRITYLDSRNEPFSGLQGGLYRHSLSRWLVTQFHGYVYFNEDAVQGIAIESGNMLHITVSLNSEVIE